MCRRTKCFPSLSPAVHVRFLSSREIEKKRCWIIKWKIKMKNREKRAHRVSSAAAALGGMGQREMSEKKRRIKFQKISCVLISSVSSVFSSFYTFLENAAAAAAAAWERRKKSRNYVDCEKTKMWNWGEYEKSNLITNWKIRRQSAEWERKKEQLVHERKRFRSEDLCVYPTGVRCGEVLQNLYYIVDSIAKSNNR